MRTTLTLLFLLLPLSTVRAQTEVLPDEEEIRRYTVEMIIFKYAQDVSTGSEIFPPDNGPSSGLPIAGQSPADTDSGTGVRSAADRRPRIMRDIELVILGRDDYTMTDFRRRLDRLDAYKPLMHFGWTQNTWPEEQTRPIELAAMARAPAELDGQLTLYLSRFLHLVVDLQLDAAGSDGNGARSNPSSPSYRDRRADLQGDALGTAAPVRYRITENRIFRNGELRYFDHPKFGVLAKVSRVEEDTIDGAADPSSVALPAR